MSKAAIQNAINILKTAQKQFALIEEQLTEAFKTTTPASTAGKLISDKQMKMAYAIRMQNSINEPTRDAILAEFGVKQEMMLAQEYVQAYIQRLNEIAAKQAEGQ